MAMHDGHVHPVPASMSAVRSSPSRRGCPDQQPPPGSPRPTLPTPPRVSPSLPPPACAAPVKANLHAVSVSCTAQRKWSTISCSARHIPASKVILSDLRQSSCLILEDESKQTGCTHIDCKLVEVVLRRSEQLGVCRPAHHLHHLPAFCRIKLTRRWPSGMHSIRWSCTTAWSRQPFAHSTHYEATNLLHG